MRVLRAMSFLCVVAACTRPASDIGLENVVHEASSGIDTFQAWLNDDHSDSRLGLCLKDVRVHLDLAHTSEVEGSLSIPLAGPGIGGALGFSAGSTEITSSNMTVVLVPDYGEGDPRDEPLPKDVETRDDLAAELWRIRQSIISALLGSNSVSGLVIAPSEIKIVRTFQAIRDASGSVKLSFVGFGDAGLSTSTSVSAENQITIMFVRNRGADQARCTAESLTGPRPDEIVKVTIVDRPRPTRPATGGGSAAAAAGTDTGFGSRFAPLSDPGIDQRRSIVVE